jgi:tetratricopeptide (TPR) repeat protein
VEIVELAGIDDSEVAELVALRAGAAPPDDLCARLRELTDGNPFFLTAVLAHLEDVAFVRSADGAWVTAAELDAAGVPRGVRGVIARRLALLGDGARRALDVAAVAGLVFDEKIIGGVLESGLSETVDALDAACASGLIREVDPGRFIFSHALVRQTVLDDLSRTRLATLHWRIAEELEHDGAMRLGEIAGHYASGRLIGDDATVVRTSLAAGEDALRRVAFEEAAGHLRTALAAVDRTPPDADLRYRILTLLGRCLNALAEVDEAQQLWLQAAGIARQARDPERVFAAIQGYGYVRRMTTDVELVRLLDDLLELLGPADSALRASALGRRAALVQNIAVVPRAADFRMADEAVAMARRTGRPDALISPLHSRLLLETQAPDVAAMLGDAQEVVAALEQAEPTTWDNTFARRLLTLALLRLGRRADAERQLEILASEAEHSGLRMAIHGAVQLRAAIATATGRFAEGCGLAEEAAQRTGRHIQTVEIGYVTQILTGRMEHGRLDEVIAGLEGMLDTFDFELPGYRAMRAGALAQAGRLVEASHELERVGAAVPSGDVERLIGHAPMAIRHVSEVCRHLADRERSTTLLAHLTPWAGQILVGGWGQTIEGASDRAIGHLLATMGRLDEADAAFTAAADLERSAGFPPLAARTQYWHARTLLERDAPGDRPRARMLLDDVVDSSGRLGMALLRDQARASREQLDTLPIR